MKARIIIVFLLIVSSLSPAQWTKVSSHTAGVGGNLTAHKSTLFIYGYFNGNKVYRSANNGASLTNITGMFPNDVYAVCSVKDDVFAVTVNSVTGAGRFYISANDGVTWSERSVIPTVTGNGAILGMTVDGSTLYAVSNRKSFYASTDNGLTWQERLVKTTVGGNMISFAAIGSTYAAAIQGTGAVVSTDGGATWETKNPASAAISSVYAYNGTIYGLPSGGGVVRFNAAAKTWEAGTGLPDLLTFEIPKAIVGSGGTLYAYYVAFLTSQASVFSSTDNGSTWKKLSSTGLPPTVNPGASVSALAVNSAGLFLYNQSQAGTVIDTAKTGLYKMTTTTSVAGSVSAPADFVLNQNYPNPFNPATVIGYRIAKDGHASLTVYDVLGHEVAALADGYHAAGSHTVRFDASQLAAGVYLYSLRTAAGTEMKKMTLVK